MHGFIYFFITHSFNTLPLWPWAGWRIEAGVEEQTEEDSNTVEVKTPYVIRNLRSGLAWGLYQSYTAQWWLDNDTVFYRLFHVLSLYHVFVSGLSVPIHEKTTVTDVHAFAHVYWTSGLPRWHSAEEPTGQCRRHRRGRFDPWVMMIPWRRKWQPTSVFLPGKFQGQTSLEDYSGATKSQTQLSTRVRACTHTHTHTHIGTMSCQISQNDHALLLEKHAQLLKCTQNCVTITP